MYWSGWNVSEPKHQEAKPCPFCGSSRTLALEARDAGFWRFCRNCKASGPAMETKAGGERGWNMRDGK